MPTSNIYLGWPGGDKPGKLSFGIPVPKSTRDFIFSAVQEFISLQDGKDDVHALTKPNSLIGRFRLNARNGDWFVKVSDVIGFPDLENEISLYLQKKNVSINPLAFTKTTVDSLGKQYRIDIRPFINGRHYNGSKKDFFSLIETVGQLHDALLYFKSQTKIRSIAAKRFNRLARIKDNLKASLKRNSFKIFAEHQAWAKEHKSWLGTMADEFNPNFHLQPHAQCLHGEIHPGNVIYNRDKATLIDFEESVHVFAPRSWDLCYIGQRFCLQPQSNEDKINEQLSSIEKETGQSVPELASMMRQIAWFAMAVILDLRNNHQKVCPQSEYDKFVRLEQQALSLTV